MKLRASAGRFLFFFCSSRIIEGMILSRSIAHKGERDLQINFTTITSRDYRGAELTINLFRARAPASKSLQGRMKLSISDGEKFNSS